MASAVPHIVPRHVAITMDGNGRWAAARGLARSAGHKAGLDPVRMCIQECTRRKVTALTLFAFSSENWRRPVEEVASLMGLFVEALDREIAELHSNGVRVRFIGDRQTLSVRLQSRIAAAEERTGANQGLRLADRHELWRTLGYCPGSSEACEGKCKWCLKAAGHRRGALRESPAARGAARCGAADPHGGEQRISNFLLWNAAYAELFFTDRLWPEFCCGGPRRRLLVLRHAAAPLRSNERADRVIPESCRGLPAAAAHDRVTAQADHHRGHTCCSVPRSVVVAATALRQ